MGWIKAGVLFGAAEGIFLFLLTSSVLEYPTGGRAGPVEAPLGGFLLLWCVGVIAAVRNRRALLLKWLSLPFVAVGMLATIALVVLVLMGSGKSPSHANTAHVILLLGMVPIAVVFAPFALVATGARRLKDD